MNRLFVDIETSPNVVLSWRAGYKIYINPDNIVRERAIICAAWKWEGEKRVHRAEWDLRQCDKALVDKLSCITADADEVVAQNGERFDIPWIRGRALFHNLDPMPLVRLVDTLKWARKYYYLNSNRLDYIGKFLGVGGKIEKFKNGDGSWRRVLMDNDRRELGEMSKYCARDVELLEKVWERLSMVCPVATHAGVIGGGEKWSCPRCASDKVFQSKRRVTAKGSEQFQMRCKSCAGYFTIAGTAHKKWQEKKAA